MVRAPGSANSRATKLISPARTRRWSRTSTPWRSSGAARRRGTCRWCSARSPSPYNVKGLNSLILDGTTAAKIFNGAINRWNDPAIQALNPGVTLPAEPIQVVFRSDQSGTSDNFQRYLDTAANGAWGKGAGKRSTAVSARAPRATTARRQPSRRPKDRSPTTNGRSPWRRHLSTAKIITSAGPDPVAISADSVGKTIACAYFIRDRATTSPSTRFSFYRPNQPGAYPIVLATYEIVCSKYPDPQVGTAVKAFLQSTIGRGPERLGGQRIYPYSGLVQVEAVRPRQRHCVIAVMTRGTLMALSSRLHAGPQFGRRSVKSSVSSNSVGCPSTAKAPACTVAFRVRLAPQLVPGRCGGGGPGRNRRRPSAPL